MYALIHSGFHNLLHKSIGTGVQTSTSAIMILLFILLVGSATGLWLARNRFFKSLCDSLSLARAVRGTTS